MNIAFATLGVTIRQKKEIRALLMPACATILITYLPFLLAPNAFEFPGGLVFKAGGYISQNVPIYNAWTTSAVPFQGIFFEAPTIITSSYQATNSNSWVNYSSTPLTGPSTAYIITQPAPTLWQFVNYPTAIHNNTYSKELAGNPPCSAPWAPPYVASPSC